MANRFVHFRAACSALAGMVADPAADTRERVLSLKQFERLAVFAAVDQSDVPLNAHVRRAGRPAGGGAPFADGVSRPGWPGRTA